MKRIREVGNLELEKPANQFLASDSTAITFADDEVAMRYKLPDVVS